MPKCVKCLKPTELDVYLRNDHYCDRCNDAYETYPLASPNHFLETAEREEQEKENALYKH